MSEITLQAETGRVTGTRPSRRLRRRGKVPAILYGQGTEAVSIAVSARDLRNALTTDAGINVLINLVVEEETHTSLARQLQRHPTRGDIIHLDFVKISLTDQVDSVVSVELIGDPAVIREMGGIIETVTNMVNVRTLVTSIPESIPVDISGLGVGDSSRVSDLPLLEGVEYLDDPDLPIVVVHLPAAVLAEEEEALEGEVAEGEAPADAEGADGAEA